MKSVSSCKVFVMLATLVLGFSFSRCSEPASGATSAKDQRLHALIQEQFGIDNADRTIVIIPMLYCGGCIEATLAWLENDSMPVDRDSFLFIVSPDPVARRLDALGYVVQRDTTAYLDRLNFDLYNSVLLFRSAGRLDSVVRPSAWTQRRLAALYLTK